jgi:predicted flap endonuclease-1-like 5' DNA nuclease
VFARRLNEAGIVTFAGLAAQPAARLAEIVAAKSWQAIDPQAWIDQAAALAGS